MPQVRCLRAWSLLQLRPYKAWMRDFHARLLLQAPMSLDSEDAVAVLRALAVLQEVPDPQVTTRLLDVSLARQC